MAEVKPGQTAIAVDHLGRQGFETLSPMMMERRPPLQRYRRPAWMPSVRASHREVEVPLFPGYLLVGFDTETDPWERVNHTRGVQELIRGAGSDMPGRVPGAMVEEIRARCKAGPMADTRWMDKFRLGASVKISEGVLSGHLGQVQRVDGARERVWLLLGFFGTVRPMEFAVDSLEAV